ncbi:MAG: hypothetical protein WCW44_03675 [archaeon]|jgi:hypothetical protein
MPRVRPLFRLKKTIPGQTVAHWNEPKHIVNGTFNPQEGKVHQLAPGTSNKKMRNLTMRRIPDIENIKAILKRRKQLAKSRKQN